MGVFEGRGQLTKCAKELAQRWVETRAGWDDSVSRAFERDHLGPLEQTMRNALGAMDHIAMVLAQARRDCEP